MSEIPEKFEDWSALTPNGVKAHFYAECDSTNRIAADIAYQKPDEKVLWVIAGKQTSGRGRRGRVWTSKPGNLYCSLLWKPSLKLSDLAPLPFITALAVRDMLVRLGASDETVSCKWPNDVLLGDRKTSGILIESSAKARGELDYIVIGIGVNLMHFPGDAAFSATSLYEHSGMSVPVSQALKHLSESMFERLSAYDTNQPASIYQEWTKYSWGLGKAREIRTADETFVGTPIALADDGGLTVETEDKGIIKIYAGDVFPVKEDT